MAKNARARAGSWHGPALQARDPDLQLPAAANAEELWDLGERAEEAFDYDSAHGLYREAARTASGRRQADLVARYATFLVERYGQFGEVAAWLDDDAFDPLAGDTIQARALAVLVATAAAEAGHPRSPDLDQILARQYGQLEALARVAYGLVRADAPDEALSLLTSFHKTIPALSEAGRLLSALRDQDDSACVAALAAVHAALDGHDPTGARAALEERRAQWQQQAVFRSTEARVAMAEQLAQAEALRRRIEAGLDADELADARTAALQLVALEPENQADRNTLGWIERRLTERRKASLITRVNACDDAAAAIDLMSTLYAEPGARAEITGRWSQAWLLVCEAADHDGPLAGAGAQLARVLELDEALVLDDAQAIAATLATVGPRWQGLRSVRRGRSRVQSTQRETSRQRETALVAEVESLLGDQDLEAAEAALQRHAEAEQERGATLRTLQKRVEELRVARERRAARLNELEQRLDQGRLFGARRLLRRMDVEGDLGGDELIAARQGLDSRWQEQMGATAVPPVGLSVSAEPVAVGVVQGRLIIVQQRLWLVVNLQTRGLQPFQLPESCDISSRPAARIAEVGRKAVLVGFSKGRLIRIEQEPGQPPVVVDGARLERLLRGDNRISGTAIEPGARSWRVLHHHTDRPDVPPAITEIDAATMEPLGVDRHRPALASLRGLQHRPDAFLVASTAEARARRGWAIAQYDATSRGRPTLHLSQQELVEPVARLSAAIAWPDADRVFASYAVYDVFNPEQVHATSSLLVLRGGKLIFASADLRRRFAPTEPLIVDHPWTLDTRSGRLWFAALPRSEQDGEDAMLIGVDAKRLRSDPAVPLTGVARILAIEPWADGAVALGRLHNGRLAVALARIEAGGDLALTIDGLPV